MIIRLLIYLSLISVALNGCVQKTKLLETKHQKIEYKVPKLPVLNIPPPPPINAQLKDGKVVMELRESAKLSKYIGTLYRGYKTIENVNKKLNAKTYKKGLKNGNKSTK